MMNPTLENQTVYPYFALNRDDLKQIFGSVKSLTNDSVKILMEADGLLMRMMDHSHIALLDIRINYKDFSEFVLLGDVLEFDIQSDEIFNIVKGLDKHGDIIFEIRKDFIEISQNGFKTQIRKLEKSAIDHPLPRISYDSKFIPKDTKYFIDLIKKF